MTVCPFGTVTISAPVTFCTAPPEAETVNTLTSPLMGAPLAFSPRNRVERNATVWPSGEMTGRVSRT